LNGPLDPRPAQATRTLAMTSTGRPLTGALVELAAASADAAAEQLGEGDPGAVERFRRKLRRVCGLVMLVRPALTASHYAGIREAIESIEAAAHSLRRPAADLAALAGIRAPDDAEAEIATLEELRRALARAAAGGADRAELGRRLRSVAGALGRALPTEVYWSTLAEGLAETYGWAAAARGAAEREPSAARVRAWARALDVLSEDLSLLGEPRDEIWRARQEAETAADLLDLARVAASLAEPRRAARRFARRGARAAGRKVARALRQTESVFGHTADCFSGALVRRFEAVELAGKLP
jgi:hypothetical protein